MEFHSFKKGHTYRNDSGRDLDMYVHRVVFTGENFVIMYISLVRRKPIEFFQEEKVEIKADNYKDWYKLK